MLDPNSPPCDSTPVEYTACAAVPIRADDGLLIGSVAVSAPVDWYAGQQQHVEHRLRACAARAGRIYRLGNRHG